MFANQSPKRTNIEEANKHLQLLHTRVQELEKQVQEKHEEAEATGGRVAEKLQAVTREKDGIIRELTQKIKTLESRVHVSQIVIKENEQTISALEKKAKKYEQLCEFAPVLRNMLALCDGGGKHMSNGTAPTPSLHIAMVPSDQTPPPSSSSAASSSSKRTYSRPQLDASPTIQEMAQGFGNGVNSHFLISEDEFDEPPKNVLARVKAEKELYL